jgi:hypothetical protein
MAELGFWIVAGLISFAVGVYLLRAVARGGDAEVGTDVRAKALAALRRSIDRN